MDEGTGEVLFYLIAAGIVVFGLMSVQAARFVPFMIATGETGEDLRLQIWPFMAFWFSLGGVLLVAVLRFQSSLGGQEAYQDERIRAIGISI